MRWRLIAVPAVVVTTAFCVAIAAGSGQPVERHLLLIRERGQDGICLSSIPEPPLGRPEKLSDRYQLRVDQGGGVVGSVLARAVTAAWTGRRCGLNVTFRVRSNLPTFDFYDATSGDIWFNLRLPKLRGGRWTRTVIAL